MATIMPMTIPITIIILIMTTILIMNAIPITTM